MEKKDIVNDQQTFIVEGIRIRFMKVSNIKSFTHYALIVQLTQLLSYIFASLAHQQTQTSSTLFEVFDCLQYLSRFSVHFFRIGVRFGF